MLQNIFPEKLKTRLKQKYDIFENEILCSWLYMVYHGEYDATVIYPKILERLQLNQDFKLLEADRDTVCKYFVKMIDDETVHTDLLSELLYKKFNKTIDYDDLNATKDRVLDRYNNSELSELLSYYYTGECMVWTGLYMLSKTCQDTKTANIFNRILKDETHHNTSIYKIYKKLNGSITFNRDLFINEVINMRYFGIQYVRQFSKLKNDNLHKKISKQNQWWFDLIYDHEWQQKFNLILLKKTYKVYAMFDPECDFDVYCRLINKKDKIEIDTKDK